MYAYLTSIEDVMLYQNDHGPIDVVSTLSGGIDSTVTAHIAVTELKDHALFLYIDYGSKVAEAELAASIVTAKLLDMPLLYISFKDFMSVNKSYLMDNNMEEPEKGIQFWSEGRNAMLTLMAANVASSIDCNYVYLSISASDSSGGYVDTDEAFIDAMNLMIKHSFRNKVRVISILLNDDLDKYEVIQRGEELGVNWLAQTHSCSSNNVPCCMYTQCESCQHRMEGFLLAGMQDPFCDYLPTRLSQFIMLKEIHPDWSYATLAELDADL